MIAAKRIYLNTVMDHWNLVKRMGDEKMPRDIVRSMGGSQMRRNFGQVSASHINHGSWLRRFKR